MFDSVCIFNNKVFSFLPDAYLVSFEYLKSGNHHETFKECTKLNIPLPNDFLIKDLFLDVVENYSVGLKCLLMLAISTTNDISTFMYCGSLSNHIFSFKKASILKKPSIEPNINLFVTHGPALIYFNKNLLEIYSLSHNTRQYLDLTTVFNDGIDSFKVHQVTALGQLDDPEPITVFLIIVSRSTNNGNEVCMLSLTANAKLNNVSPNYKKLPTSHFFPSCLQNVIKTINVANINIVEDNVNWKNNFCCLVTNEECLVFDNSILKYVAKLPFCDVLQIRTDFCDFQSGTIKLLFVSENEAVHVLTGAGSSDLQLSKTWASVKSVLCGDILLNGSKQLLLLKDTSFYSWQDGCIASDLSTSNPVDVLCQSSDSDASMSRAIPGLLAKVQKGKSLIVEAESKISKKTEATLDALFRLKGYGSENEFTDPHVSTFQESLVDIILHNDEIIRTKENTSICLKPLKVLNHWIKFIDGRCVFCWTLMNTNEKPIFNPTLIIMIPNQQIQSTQKLFIHKSGSFTINDECSREINPGETFSIVASTELMEFHEKDTEVSAIISWYRASSTEFENELYLSMQDKTLFQHQLNLKTVVSALQVFNTQLEDISSAEHLACLKVVQQRIVLQVFALHSSIDEFENMLLTTAYGAAHLLLLENPDMRCLLFKSANLPLFGVHMVFNSLGPNTLEIEAFTKDNKQTYLLVQFLYQYLPDDIIILPQGATFSEHHKQQHQAMCAMKDELDLLLSTFAIHNVTEKIEVGNVSSLNEPGTVVIPKETFLRIRKALVKKECATDNVVRELTCMRFSNNKG